LPSQRCSERALVSASSFDRLSGFNSLLLCPNSKQQPEQQPTFNSVAYLTVMILISCSIVSVLAGVWLI
jgi:hypothetical protein